MTLGYPTEVFTEGQPSSISLATREAFRQNHNVGFLKGNCERV